MIVEDSDALMTWLSAILEPLCDADPAALSKYVVALIKKEKPESELKESMMEQMEVFLQESTTTFIESLFKTLQSKEYLEGPPKVALKKADESDEDKYEVGKPDSTTSTPANVNELTSDLRDAEHKSSRRSPPPMGRRSSPKDRRSSPARRRRSSGHRRHRSRSRSPYNRRRRSPFNRRSRSRSYSPRRQSRSPPPRRYASRGSTPTRDEDGYTPSTIVGTKRPRCRDYDEKGFCLKGDQCKFDHGNDAVVLEDTPPSNTSVPPPPYLPGGYAEPYVPASTTVLPPLHLPPPGYPANPSQRKRSYEDPNSGNYPPAKRFDYKRLGGRGRGRGGAGGASGGRPGSSKVLVKNIPSGLNTIAHINNHFARFGTLVNVQIHFEGDPAAALVSFAHPNEATAAMNSPDAVFGNRFIKMFYSYNQDSRPVKDRLGSSTTDEKVTLQGSTITKTIVNTEAASSETESAVEPISVDTTAEESALKESKKAAAIAAIKKNQEVLEMKAKMKKEADLKKIDAAKKTDGLIKSKQELLEKLIDEQKKLILKIEAKKGNFKGAEEKTSMMALLKNLSTSIDKIKEDIKLLLSQQTGKDVRKSFLDVQKELLDAELELFNAQQDGNDNVEDIQKRVNRLRIEAAQKGFLPTSRPARGAGGRGGSPMMARGARGAYGRGGGFSRGRSMRGCFRGLSRRNSHGGGLTSIDRRPTTIMLADIEAEQKDAALAHMSKFGEIIDTSEDQGGKSITIQYKTRREAEIAMTKGNKMGETSLNMSWLSTSIGETAELETEEADVSGLEEAADILDDYTPLDPTYLPPGIEEAEKKDTAMDDDLEDRKDDEEEEEEEEEEDPAERSWKR